MMIWDIIRDWFVMNIWGGLASNYQSYGGFVGLFYNSSQGTDTGLTNDTFVPVKVIASQSVRDYISLGDWLSTTSTIIILIAVSVGLFYLTRYFFRMFAGLLAGR